jgi:hypothetical protein
LNMRHKLFFVWAQLKQFVLFSSSRFATLNLFHFFFFFAYVDSFVKEFLHYCFPFKIMCTHLRLSKKQQQPLKRYNVIKLF